MPCHIYHIRLAVTVIESFFGLMSLSPETYPNSDALDVLGLSHAQVSLIRVGVSNGSKWTNVATIVGYMRGCIGNYM